MKALEILRDNFIAIATDTDTEMAMYYQDHIQIAIKELEALENRSCANCKRVDKCKLASDVVNSFGTKLKEQCFYCWESK